MQKIRFYLRLIGIFSLSLFLIFRLLRLGDGRIAKFSEQYSYIFLTIAGSMFCLIIVLSILNFVYNFGSTHLKNNE